MVDATELIIITSLVQTIVITLTLVVFIFQFRGQEKAIRESSYQNVMGRYTDYVRMLVERPELTRLLADMGNANQITGRSNDKLSPEDTTTLAYLLLGYGINRRSISSLQKEVDRRRNMGTMVRLPSESFEAPTVRPYSQRVKRNL